MVILLLVVAAAVASAAGAVTLGIESSQFTLDGKPTFLCGISYYGGCAAPPEVVSADLDEFAAHGINWIRVWATWERFADVSAVDEGGQAREPYMTRLRELVAAADARGIVVDVTLHRGDRLKTHNAHLAAVATLARELMAFRNVYFDVANERNIRDTDFVSFEQCGELVAAVRAVDPARLVTASHIDDITSMKELRGYLQIARVDFVTPHRPRYAASPSATEGVTRQLLAWMAELGVTVPVHYQEPFRRDYTQWQPTTEDFLTDLAGAIAGGAAGWCLHNGSNRHADEGHPRRSFDMTLGQLVPRLDDTEHAVMQALPGLLRGNPNR